MRSAAEVHYRGGDPIGGTLYRDSDCLMSPVTADAGVSRETPASIRIQPESWAPANASLSAEMRSRSFDVGLAGAVCDATATIERGPLWSEKRRLVELRRSLEARGGHALDCTAAPTGSR